MVKLGCLRLHDSFFVFIKTDRSWNRKEVRTLPRVDLRSGESQQQLYSRFRKAVTRSGVLSTLRKKRWFVSKNELRRIQKKKAIRRARRRGFTKTRNF